jgi:hypothetical protein
MQRVFALIISLLLGTSCQTPKQAAGSVCDCLHETVRDWENDEKLTAFVHFAKCGEEKDKLKQQFSGADAIEFEAEFDTCLRQTVSSELLYMLLKKEDKPDEQQEED